MLLLKYEYQMPPQRISGLLRGHGLDNPAPGTLSIFATPRLNDVAARPFLHEYFAAAAARGGVIDAETVKTLLPWNLPEERRKRLMSIKDPPEKS